MFRPLLTHRQRRQRCRARGDSHFDAAVLCPVRLRVVGRHGPLVAIPNGDQPPRVNALMDHIARDRARAALRQRQVAARLTRGVGVPGDVECRLGTRIERANRAGQSALYRGVSSLARPCAKCTSTGPAAERTPATQSASARCCSEVTPPSQSAAPAGEAAGPPAPAATAAPRQPPPQSPVPVSAARLAAAARRPAARAR